MTVLASLDEIKSVLSLINPLPLIEAGFAAYSRGEVVVAPVSEMIFPRPPGDVHIKSGYIKGDDTYIIKIASGFYDNPKIGRPSSNGLMLLFSLRDGALKGILFDEGYLTDVRTAAAGAVAARVLAPARVVRAGIVGAGTQARAQLQFLRRVREFRDVMVWGLDKNEIEAYKADMEPKGFRVATTLDAGELAAACNVIVTCTPSTKPLLWAGDIRPGTHITAVGSDTPDKQELDPAILGLADRIVVDSLVQSRERGEVYRAGLAGVGAAARAVELGAVIMDPGLGRVSEDEITVADLTGVAVQDVQIAKAVFAGLSRGQS